MSMGRTWHRSMLRAIGSATPPFLCPTHCVAVIRSPGPHLALSADHMVRLEYANVLFVELRCGGCPSIPGLRSEWRHGLLPSSALLRFLNGRKHFITAPASMDISSPYLAFFLSACSMHSPMLALGKFGLWRQKI